MKQRAVMVAALFSCLAGCSSERLQAVELRSNSLWRELLAHWAFDEAAGTVAHDDSGNLRDGTLTGSTSWLPDGRFAGALHLGAGQFVSVPRFPSATSSFTVSAWVRFLQPPIPSGRWGTIVSTEEPPSTTLPPSGGGWEVNVDYVDPAAPALHFGFWKGPTLADYEGFSCPGAPLDRWSQIVGVSDTVTSTYSIYRDGVICYSTATTHKILPGSATLDIGQWPNGGRFLMGDVDDIAIWGRALVPAEIELLAHASVPPSP